MTKVFDTVPIKVLIGCPNNYFAKVYYFLIDAYVQFIDILFMQTINRLSSSICIFHSANVNVGKFCFIYKFLTK